MTNGAAIGYMILAARMLNLPEKTIKDLESHMVYKMDFADEDYAEKVYQNT